MPTQTDKLRRGNCDLQRIDSFLEGDCGDNGSLDVHLESCSGCRRYLRKHAAGDDMWRDAMTLLQRDEFDAELEANLRFDANAEIAVKRFPESGLPGAAIGYPVNAARSSDDRGATIRSVLDALLPSEDPRRLGRLGIYEITGVVGSGGMGVVLKAIDPSLDRTVAIKVMSPFLAGSGAARKRFAREAKAAAAVLHANVISIHGVSADADLPYLVMTYIGGGSLQKRLAEQGPFNPAELLRIGSQVAAGLAAAHDQGLVHRDIKPANIMLENGIERIAITDFGLARAVDDASITRDGVIAGTPQYMSPEQAGGESVSQRSDLFSLGSVLYALATGRPPFRAETSYGVMRKILDESPVPIRELNPDMPDWLCKVIEKLMSKAPNERFASAREVSQLLESSLAHIQQPAVALPDLVSKLVRNSAPRFYISRKLLIATAFFAAAFAASFAALFFLIPGKQDFASRDKTSEQIAGLLASWKEQGFGTLQERAMQDEMSALHQQQSGAQQSGADETEALFKNKSVWAVELLPVLLAGVESDKALFLVEFTEPFGAIRSADEAAENGTTTEPIGWEWQAVHMLALGRLGRITDAYSENDRLIRKIQLNLDNRGGQDFTADFFGQERSLPEILRECRLHRALVEAIDGPATPGPADGVADGVEEPDSEADDPDSSDETDQQDESAQTMETKPELPKQLAETLAAIPERPSLLQADEKFLAIFEVSGDEMIAKAVRGDEEAAQLGVACWQRLTTLFPSDRREGLVQFNIQGGERWAGFFNGGGSNDVGYPGYSLSIAKFQALKEQDIGDRNRPVTPRRGTLDWTTVHEMGHYICLTTGAIELFSQAFDGDDQPQPPRREHPDDYPEDGSPVLDGNFVTSYAERTRGDEEVCETFTTYLLIDELPENDSLVARKIRFFETLPGYPELREHIQKTGEK